MFFGVIGVIKCELGNSALLAEFHPMNIVELLAKGILSIIYPRIIIDR